MFIAVFVLPFLFYVVVHSTTIVFLTLSFPRQSGSPYMLYLVTNRESDKVGRLQLPHTLLGTAEEYSDGLVQDCSNPNALAME